MLSRVHDRLGTAGFVISIVALVVALGGTAFAAAKLSGGEKKEVEKIAKKFAGPKGATGPAGTNGAQGPVGAQGPAGSKGADGTAGAGGAAGAAGKSVVIGATAPNCTGGGKTVEVEGSGKKSEICDGEEGPPGSPWTAGGTLPPEATETGTWAVGRFGAPAAASSIAYVPISFSIPLAAPIAGGHMHYINAVGKEVKLNSTTFEPEELTSTACKGSAANPTAEPGDFCLYTGFLSNGEAANISFLALNGLQSLDESQITSYTAGTTFGVSADNGTEPIEGIGTWAVTAPAAGS
jgi:Collagen triple helix repeat (20 copies)